MSHLSMWTMMTMTSVCGNKARLISWAVNVMGIWDHLVWVMGHSIVSYPGSESGKPKLLYLCLGYSNHTCGQQ
jgi:hypothetical protein